MRSQWTGEDSHKQDDETLAGQNQTSGLDETPVVSVIRAVFAVYQQPGDRRGRPENNQGQVAGDLRHERPKTEFLLCQELQGQWHGRENVEHAREQEQVTRGDIPDKATGTGHGVSLTAVKDGARQSPLVSITARTRTESLRNSAPSHLARQCSASKEKQSRRSANDPLEFLEGNKCTI